MAISCKKNKLLKSLVPNSILVIIENHNGNQVYFETFPAGIIFQQSMTRLKDTFSQDQGYKIKTFTK